MADPAEVLDFWLGEIGPDGWYKGGEEIDLRCMLALGEEAEAAALGHLEHWVAGPGPCLAYLILTDQMPRNIQRGKPASFASDPLARRAARAALEAGWDLEVPEPERQFFYLPFEHSEDAADQELSVRLFTERLPSSPENILHARAHQAVIVKFGRFPTRNAVLGRASTQAEQDWLDAGGYMAEVKALTA
jgi:uncharacterized protein (DUF924 family)